MTSDMRAARPGASGNGPKGSSSLEGAPTAATLPRERPVRLSRAVQHWVCSLPREQRRRLLARLGDLGELDRTMREPGLNPAPPVVAPVGGGR